MFCEVFSFPLFQNDTLLNVDSARLFPYCVHIFWMSKMKGYNNEAKPPFFHSKPDKYISLFPFCSVEVKLWRLSRDSHVIYVDCDYHEMYALSSYLFSAVWHDKNTNTRWMMKSINRKNHRRAEYKIKVKMMTTFFLSSFLLGSVIMSHYGKIPHLTVWKSMFNILPATKYVEQNRNVLLLSFFLGWLHLFVYCFAFFIFTHARMYVVSFDSLLLFSSIGSDWIRSNRPVAKQALEEKKNDWKRWKKSFYR